MAQVPNSIPITGPITPIDDADKYPTHFSKYGVGGFYSVNTYADLELISTSRLGDGEPLIYVKSDNRFYMYKNDTWSLVDFSNGNSCCDIVDYDVDGDEVVVFTV